MGRKPNGISFVKVIVSAVILTFTVLFGCNLNVYAKEGIITKSLSGGIGAFLSNSERVDEVLAEAGKFVTAVSPTENLEGQIVMANVKSALNVRKTPSEEGEKVGKLYKDCGGTILEKKSGWTKLQSGNIIGWCSDEYLLFGEEAENLANDVGQMIATVSTESVRVRTEASKTADVMCILPKGDLLEVIDNSDVNWIEVDVDGEDGFISADCLDVTFKIDAGETLAEIKVREAAEAEAKRHVNYGQYTTDVDSELLLAAIIHCEARGESYEGQIAVGAVVMNRVRSAAYPDTIHGVIYASGQFTPAMTGKLNQVLESGKINDSCKKAAAEALAGTSNVGDCTHFRRDNGTRTGIIIGNHVFY